MLWQFPQYFACLEPGGCIEIRYNPGYVSGFVAQIGNGASLGESNDLENMAESVQMHGFRAVRDKEGFMTRPAPIHGLHVLVVAVLTLLAAVAAFPQYFTT